MSPCFLETCIHLLTQTHRLRERPADGHRVTTSTTSTAGASDSEWQPVITSSHQSVSQEDDDDDVIAKHNVCAILPTL